MCSLGSKSLKVLVFLALSTHAYAQTQAEVDPPNCQPRLAMPDPDNINNIDYDNPAQFSRIQAASLALIGTHNVVLKSTTQADQDIEKTIIRNKIIGLMYAKLYLAKYDTIPQGAGKNDARGFLWLPGAVLASETVGNVMKTFKNSYLDDPSTSAADRAVATTVIGNLGAGNYGIFNDLYWQHLAAGYSMDKAAKTGQDRYLDFMPKVAALQKIPAASKNDAAWRMVIDGIRDGRRGTTAYPAFRDKIWNGSVGPAGPKGYNSLVDVEQGQILQPMIFDGQLNGVLNGSIAGMGGATVADQPWPSRDMRPITHYVNGRLDLVTNPQQMAAISSRVPNPFFNKSVPGFLPFMNGYTNPKPVPPPSTLQTIGGVLAPTLTSGLSSGVSAIKGKTLSDYEDRMAWMRSSISAWQSDFEAHPENIEKYMRTVVRRNTEFLEEYRSKNPACPKAAKAGGTSAKGAHGG